MNNRLQHEALGNNHRVYSPEPRAEVYCLRLKFDISKLVYYFFRVLKISVKYSLVGLKYQAC